MRIKQWFGTHSLMILAVSSAILFTTTAALFVSPQENTQAVKVRLRLVPVTVTDSKGRPVKGLKADDFELYVDGKTIPIRSLDEYDYSGLREQVRQGKEPQYTGAELPPRRILLVFDVLSSGIKGYQAQAGDDSPLPSQPASQQYSGGQKALDLARGILMSKNAAKSWVESEMLPSDHVAVMAYHYYGELLQPYTKNKELLCKAIDRITVPHDMIGPDIVGGGSTPSDEIDAEFADTATFSRVEMEIAQKSEAYMSFYDRLGKLLAGIPGTKQIILFSEGLAIHKDNKGLSVLPDMEKAEQSLSSSNTRVTSIGIAGLERKRVGSYQVEFLNSMAYETGGTFIPSRAQLDGSLREASESFDHYYELFFSPQENEVSGFHRLEVRVKRDGAHIQAPPGYLGDRSFDRLSAAEREIQLTQDFWKPLLANELGAELGMSLLPYGKGKAALHLRSVIPNSGKIAATKRSFDASFTLGRDGEMYDNVRWKAKGNSLAEKNLQLDLLVPLPTGQSSLQFVVRDNRGGQRAYLLSGMVVPNSLPKITMSKIYLVDPQAQEDGSKLTVEMSKKPKKLTDQLPAALISLAEAPQLETATAGSHVKAMFIFRGFDFNQLYLKLKSGENEQQLAAGALEQQPLSEGLRIVSVSFAVPNWDASGVELELFAPYEKKIYRLGNTKFSIE